MRLENADAVLGFVDLQAKQAAWGALVVRRLLSMVGQTSQVYLCVAADLEVGGLINLFVPVIIKNLSVSARVASSILSLRFHNSDSCFFGDILDAQQDATNGFRSRVVGVAAHVTGPVKSY